jgi:hypothetical protein
MKGRAPRNSGDLQSRRIPPDRLLAESKQIGVAYLWALSHVPKSAVRRNRRQTVHTELRGSGRHSFQARLPDWDRKTITPAINAIRIEYSNPAEKEPCATFASPVSSFRTASALTFRMPCFSGAALFSLASSVSLVSRVESHRRQRSASST